MKKTGAKKWVVESDGNLASGAKSAVGYWFLSVSDFPSLVQWVAARKGVMLPLAPPRAKRVVSNEKRTALRDAIAADKNTGMKPTTITIVSAAVEKGKFNRVGGSKKQQQQREKQHKHV